MKRALSYLTLINLFFLLFLSLSGFADGALGAVLYYCAFLVPAGIAYFVKSRLELPPSPPSLKMTGKKAALLIPVIAPTLLLVFLISCLTSLILSFFGEGSVTDVSGNIVAVILTHAVLTAICEELLFRYIPLSFISPYTKRGAVLVSALFFAFAHCNLYQIPYAFFAGVIFAVVDLVFDSIWPSVLIHFLNNLVSILWLRNFESENFATAYILILCSLALISIIVLLLLRGKYKEEISRTFKDKRKYKLSLEILVFIGASIVIALFGLFR